MKEKAGVMKIADSARLTQSRYSRLYTFARSAGPPGGAPEGRTYNSERSKPSSGTNGMISIYILYLNKY